MVLTIALLIALTVAAAVTVLAPRLAAGRVRFAVNPDPPVPFGYKMAWLALRTRDTEAVVRELGLVAPEPCNWNSGIGTIYDHRLGANHVYVSPPVNGWTFVAGLSIPHPVGRSFVDKCSPLLSGLGRTFSEVHYYFSYPAIDFFAWARIVDRRLVRAFAITDEGVIWNKGKPTREERALGLKLFDFRGVRERRGDAGGEMIFYPTEEHVMRLARKWSLDPSRLSAKSDAPATGMTGVIALAPPAWRPERLRRTA